MLNLDSVTLLMINMINLYNNITSVCLCWTISENHRYSIRTIKTGAAVNVVINVFLDQ